MKFTVVAERQSLGDVHLGVVVLPALQPIGAAAQVDL
jgi:hypothetical protein